MVRFSANKPNRTLTIHLTDCRIEPKGEIQPCGCAETGEWGNQVWWCEKHFSIKALNEFMKHRQWAVILCHICLDKAKD